MKPLPMNNDLSAIHHVLYGRIVVVIDICTFELFYTSML